MKLLFVDNEDDIVSLMEIALMGDDIELTVAGSGSEGISAIDSGDFDVFLFDLMMPKPDGLDLLARVRTTPRHADKPVVIWTAKVSAATERTLLGAGATAVLPKPFDPLDLPDYLRRLTEQTA